MLQTPNASAHAEYVSTTKLLRMAHDISGGDIDSAIEHLRHLASEYDNAFSAIRVLRMKMQKRQGASQFTVERDGFVTVA